MNGDLMARFKVQARIRKDGRSDIITIPVEVMKALGWSTDDILDLDCDPTKNEVKISKGV